MIYFIVYIFLEVMISSTVAGNIGGLLTFLEIVLSAIFGIVLLKNYKYAIKENLMSVANKQMSQEDFMKQNIFVALGAILLVIPGFFTDFIGLLFQFQFFAQIIARRVLKKNTSSFANNYKYTSSQRFDINKKDTDVIDVEIIDDKHIIDK